MPPHDYVTELKTEERDEQKDLQAIEDKSNDNANLYYE